MLATLQTCAHHLRGLIEWLAVSELAFEWAESYDDKVSL